ncbi:unnamed protein product [Cyclocybe aegerita]|uniref:CBD9-like protein n=1 Tax=Cyclocybe aegerita TaxID=1973307 RepID=A0A8S0W5C2_CYCAE|nr:unnamed protein product [Cyclocybe aegerita]
MLPLLVLFLLQFLVSASGLQPNLYTRQQQTVTGDSSCGTSVCIAATVNGSTTTYVVSSSGNRRVGWMGMGFGSQMANTPMVIMWLNSDGTVALSQRSATRLVMPTVDSDPPRIASFSSGASVLSGSTLSFAFTIPSNSDTRQSVIYALGTTTPSSSAVDAPIVQHIDAGTLSLDLTKQVSTSTTTSSGTSPTSTGTSGSGTGTGSGSTSIPLQPHQKVIVAHAVFCTVGFLLFLPAGVLVARFMRIFIPTWFQGHWILQWGIAGPTILIGIILGIVGVGQAGAQHLDDNHKRWGIALFILYLVQCAFGAVVHFIKKQNLKHRPPQNYAHAILGLAVIGLAFYQVRSGYHEEWPLTTGRDPLPSGVDVLFWIWVALLPLAYAAGLVFLPKQYRQEKEAVKMRRQDNEGNFNLKQTSYQQYSR